MRAGDRALPSVVLDDATNLAQWPVRPVIAIATDPTPPYGWDTPDVTYDDPTPIVYDPAPVFAPWVDATCDWTGLEVVYGPPDDHGLFPAGQLIVQLDNRSGKWSQYDLDGTPASFRPGAAIDVWAHSDTGGVGPPTVTYGPPENIAVGSTPASNNTNFEIGVSITFAADGRVASIRYRRLASSGTLNLRAWNPSAPATPLFNVAENPAGTGQTGLFTVTLPTPLTVTAGQTVRFSMGSTGGVPYKIGTQTVTNSTNCTFVQFCQNAGAGAYPGTGSTGVAFYVEPVFEPAITGPPTPTGNDSWLFSGTVARWDERADDTVEIEAFDVFSDLAQSIATFTPGVAGQKPGVRLEAILTAAGRSAVPHRFAAGTVTLTAQATDRSPLEEAQTVQSSDGGVLYGDADGTLVAADRNWRSGRTDQTVFPVASDNVCSAPIIVWDPILSTNDTGLADTVILENVAKLKSQTPATVSGFVLAESEQQWTTQAEGDTLASVLLNAQHQPRVRVESFDLYLWDRNQPDLWRAVDWRLFDVFRFVHDTKVLAGTARLDVTTLITSIGHAITPEGWVMTVGTSKALTYVAPILWNTVVYTWSDPSPLAVWGY